MRRLLLLPVLLLLLAAPAGAAGLSDGTQPYEFFQLEGLVEAWTGREDVVLECLSMPAYGMADIETAEMWINRRYCKPLSALVGGLEIVPAKTADGVLTLAHEAHHLKGDYNEARTECIAMQEVDDLALFLGARPEWAEVLQVYGTQLSMEFQAMAPAYRNWRKCRENGAWDRSPNDGRWP